MIKTISAFEFTKKIISGEKMDILDVRTQIECKGQKLECDFLHVPLHHLDAEGFAKSDKGKKYREKTLYILCRSGARARKAAEDLQKAGLNPTVVEGGMMACVDCNAPVSRGKVFSLERQVRIAAGSFVLTGLLLGYFVNSGFYIFSGIIGSGLIFAGITDTCGLALVLALAAWNKDKTQNVIHKSIQEFQRKENNI